MMMMMMKIRSNTVTFRRREALKSIPWNYFQQPEMDRKLPTDGQYKNRIGATSNEATPFCNALGTPLSKPTVIHRLNTSIFINLRRQFVEHG